MITIDADETVSTANICGHECMFQQWFTDKSKTPEVNKVGLVAHLCCTSDFTSLFALVLVIVHEKLPRSSKNWLHTSTVLARSYLGHAANFAWVKCARFKCKPGL